MTRSTQIWTLAAFAALALACLLASLLAGSASLSMSRALAALGGGGDELAGTIVRTIRLPRTISAFAVGSLLGLAGVLLQALFRNPLADPFVLGVSGGASVGALAGMLAGISLGGLEWTATAGALVRRRTGAAGSGSGAETGRLLLSGVVLASACGAVISVLLAHRGQRPAARHGVLAGRRPGLGAASLVRPRAPRASALLIALVGGRALNVLAAGEMRSAVLGLDARLARPLVFLVAAALTSLAVLAAGPVGFVGLVAPHLVRLALRSSRSPARRARRRAVRRRTAVPRRHRQPHRGRAAPAAGGRDHCADRRAGVPAAADAASGARARAH